MKYEKGDIIIKSGIVFKDNFLPDPKGKRPAMIAIAINEESRDMYFLTLTSQVNRYFEVPEDQKKYVVLKPTDDNKLNKASLVNLQNIYKSQISNDVPVAHVWPNEYKKVIRKLKEWQESTDEPDELYAELKPLLQ